MGTNAADSIGVFRRGSVCGSVALVCDHGMSAIRRYGAGLRRNKERRAVPSGRTWVWAFLIRTINEQHTGLRIMNVLEPGRLNRGTTAW